MSDDNRPEGLSASQFENAIADYRRIVGQQNVYVSRDDIEPYLKCYIPVDEALYAPAGAIAVSSVEEVQAVVRISNRYGIPLWPISTGRNFGYGAALPAKPGQMILDLRKMNRIIDVDPELGTALVEPGVTYQQLYDYLKQNDMPLWLCVPGPGPLVGPVGQGLIRGEGYTAYSEQFTSVCGMEVVMPDGDILRTGFGGVEGNDGSPAWQVNKYGYGPYLDGIFSQSNFGIVTKMGLWLMPEPPDHELIMVVYPEFSDIEKAIDLGRKLKLQDVLRAPIIVAPNATGMALAGVPRSTIKPGAGHLTVEDIQQFARDTNTPAVSAVSALHGTRDQINASIKLIEDELRGTGGTLLYGEAFDNALPPTLRDHFHHSYTGQPDLQEFALLNWIGGGGCIWFAPVCPTKGTEIMKQVDMMQSLADEFRFDFIDAFFVNGRSTIHLYNLFYDKTDAEQTSRAYAFFEKAQKVFAEKGYGVYRSNPAFMKATADVFGEAQIKVNRQIKKALDPNNIISPGMSGISV